MNKQKTIKTILIGGFVSLWVFIVGFVVSKTGLLEKQTTLSTYKIPVLAYKSDTTTTNNSRENTLSSLQIEKERIEKIIQKTELDSGTYNNEESNTQIENTQEFNNKNIQKKELTIQKEQKQHNIQNSNKTPPPKQETQQEENYSSEQQEENKNNLKKKEQVEKQMCGNFPCYSGEEFVQLYNSFEEHNPKLQSFTKYIYNNKEVDDYIRHIAELRGYRQRKFANPSDLVPFSERQTRPELRDAYINMRDVMKKDGAILHFVSAYRSSSHQRKIFKNKMGAVDVLKIPSGIYDKKLDTVLKVSSIPGYSKHHSGYAVDFGCGNDYLVYSFNTTNCYQWLSKNNFENAKRFGFIPSYPDGAEKQGPDPEPWEFVWVGVDTIKAGL